MAGPDDSIDSTAKSTDDTVVGSVSLMIRQLRENSDQIAATKLFERYFEQLVERMQRRINRKVRAFSGADDTAIFAMRAVLENLERGRYPKLNDRDSLWKMLVHIGDQRSKQQWRYSTAAKRDVNRLSEGTGVVNRDSSTPAAFDPESEAIPDTVLIDIQDMIGHLHARLSEMKYGDLLIWELQGYTPAEIKDRLEAKLQRPVSDSSIRRWRRLLREELRAAYPNDYPQD